MTMNTIAASLALWKGYKNRIFWALSKKSQFSVKIYPLKITSQKKNLVTNFSDALNSRSTISNWFFEIPLVNMPNQTPVFRLLKCVFQHFLTIFWVFKDPLQNKKQKTFSLFKLLHQNQFSSEYFSTKAKAVLWKLQGKFPGRHKLLFWKWPKNPNFLVCDDVISSYFLILTKTV